MPASPLHRLNGSDRPLSGGRWEVQLLGGLLLRNGDVEITRFGRRAATLLFARLALEPHKRHLRDELALALWPELAHGGDPEHAEPSNLQRDRLRRVLHTLRAQLEPPGLQPACAIVADRDTVRLNADGFDIDTARFESHVARGQWQAARACYRGELLPGLRDRWVNEHRARLAALLNRVDSEHAIGQQAADPDEEPWRARYPPAGDTAPQRPIVPYRTRFFGREAEVEILREAIGAHRLVTITGPGGSGKTRLAAETARRLAGFDPPAFVALTECAAPAHLYEHLRAALGLQPAARPALEQIVARLDGQRTLLVLDNFEQLVGAAGNAVLSTLLKRLPEVHLLLTSRRALRHRSGHRFELGPLPLPEADLDIGLAAHNPGVALFLDRARAARLDFGLNARNVVDVVEICRLLEGLPLAIELAAAKVRSQAPHKMLEALRRGLKLLARPPVWAGKAGRHASLEATLAWGWALLGERERGLLCSLSVFRGGWNLEQARAVARGAATDRALDALARDSLVQASPATDGLPRFGMLAVVREFVEGRLEGAEALALRRRHRTHFLALAIDLDARHEWPAAADQPNFVEALASACADDDTATAAALAVALAGHWRACGAPEKALGLLQHIAQAPGVPASQRVALLSLLSSLSVNAGQAEQAHAQAAQAVEAAGDDPLLRAEALFAKATVHWRAGRDGPAAQALLREAEALAPANAASARLRGRLLLLKGALALSHDQDAAGAALLFEQAERLFGGLRDRHASVLALPGRTACLLAQGRLREAIAVASAGEQLAGELGDVVTRLQLFDRLSGAHEASEQFDRAVEACQHQVRLARAHGMAYYVAFGAWNQCHPLARLGRPETAALLMAFARRYWVEQFGPLTAEDGRYIDRVRDSVGAQIGRARWRTLRARGAALSLHDGIELAMGRGDGRAGRPRT